MNAKEAKEITTKALRADMQPIWNMIRQAADGGDFITTIQLKGRASKAGEVIVSELKSQGYKVSRNKGEDQRDGSWDYLEISWL